MEHRKGETEHFNCTRCKEDQGRYGIRHKFAGGLFCERCLRELHHGSGGFFDYIRGFFGNIWDFIVDTLDRFYRVKSDKQKRKEKDTEIKVKMKVAQMKARNILGNPASRSPQKR